MISKIWLNILWCSGFLLAVVVGSVLVSLYRNRYIYRFAKTVNGFPFYPVIGNLHKIGKTKLFEIVNELPNKLGTPFGFWTGHQYSYVTDDVDEVKMILNNPHSIDKSCIYEQLRWLFGNSLLVVEGPQWKTRRRHFVKSFSPSILKSFVEFFYTNSTALVDALRKPDRPDLYIAFQNYSIDGFCEAIMGRNYNTQKKSEYSIVEDLDRLQEICRKRCVFEVFNLSVVIWGFIHEGLKTLGYLKAVSEFVNVILKDKRRDFKQSPVIADTTLKIADTLLNGDMKLTDKEIEDEITLFLSAASDTTGTTMAFIVTLLGMYEEVQEKMYEEVMTYVGDKAIGPEDLHNLKYTERVILESMRILPPIPTVGRHAKQDIHCGSKVIPKGVDIYINIIKLHRNEKFWPDPLRFNPDRFLPEEVAKRPKYCYIPFSAGPRNCIGKTYAIMSMKTSLANIVRNLKITSKYKSLEELNFHSFVTMRTITQLDCHFTARKKE
ncbi:cytochrome P450 4C1-like isoform X2 [Rhynchophorus ferrugineus]|uniref:cytochrome P450 4C1-like isoform X1 n=1 Tax=Rhynchophorus ferrugineus TaxID=354439 RepID=UPI003FCE5075